METDSRMEELVSSSNQNEGLGMDIGLGGQLVIGDTLSHSDADIHTEMKEHSTNPDTWNNSITWTAPDASFSKLILKRGSGFAAPNDGSKCLVTLTVPAHNGASALDSCLDLGYPIGEEVEIVLGNGCGEFSESIDACLETMHQGEECALRILDGKNEKYQKCIKDNSDSYVESEACGDGVVATVNITLHRFARNKDIHEMSVADILLRAKELKEFGTQCFKDGRQQLADRFYIQALRYLISVCHPKDVNNLDESERQEFLLLKRTCSLNLAACQLKHKRYRDVITHCSYALEEEPANTKALYRRCQAYIGLDEFESARLDIQTVLDQDPKNKPFLEQQRLLVKREKQVYNKLSLAMNKMFGGGS